MSTLPIFKDISSVRSLKVSLRKTWNPNIGMFGYSRQDVEGKPKFHGGIDLIPDGREPLGEPVMAAEEGRVVKIITHSNDYGNYVIMLHNSEAEVYYTYYAHLDKVLVKGLEVEAGQVIGIMGNSGNDDPHLHFEIRNRDWEKLDPGRFYWI